MVAYLSKSDASARFDQIIDFLNAHAVQYALVVNPTIYVSCIKQFWASATIKKCVSAKRTAWNKFSCSMASAVICLATGRKFKFSKYIFDIMVRNVDNPTNFLMYPRFLQVVTNNQVDDLTSHNTTYTSPALTQKVFTNIRRVGKGFSRVETPLFASMRMHPNRGKIKAIDDDEDISLVDVETQVNMDAELQGRINQDVSAAIKDVSAAEPNMLHAEEIEKAAAREKQGNDDLKRAKVLQQQHDDKQENIDWNAVAEQIQEKHLDNIRKYQSLKKKPVSIAQAKKNMIIYLKNMAGYKMEHFRGMTYDKVRPIFEREYKKVQTLFNPDKDVEEPQKKRVVEETLLQESFKKLKAVEVSGSDSTQETPSNYPKEMSKEDEIHSEGSRTYWKIIRVGGITEAYQSFKDTLKGFDREDLVALWSLVKEKFSSVVPNVDKEKALWVELKRLFDPYAYDVLWKLQRYMHYPITWKLYTNCGVHQVSSTRRRHDMFMLIEKDYPLSNGVMTLMLSAKLQVEEDSEIDIDLVMKIFMKANKLKSKSLDTSFN
uniref:Xylulose kinase-1 n=1 Tax=Tanacetum cinerariifolium TaxID=118510 RepID=A0A6L2K879_TANCI|nr:hypothetical protein [Tanacetum cinerariifolium]